MQYLYLDESGDLGFDFITKKPSRFFTITVLTVNGHDEHKKLTKAVIKTKVRMFGRDNAELKGSKTSFAVKQELFHNLREVNYGLYAITLNKVRVNKDLTFAKDRLYNYVANCLMQKVDLDITADRVNLVVDRSKSKKEVADFNGYIFDDLKGRIQPTTPLDINHQLSHETPGLQAVDMFAWGFFRKHERTDMEWYEIYKEKVKFETVYLPPK